ncbi:TetR/AcrR family transcriptional regulator [Microcella sp.]|uniref:TetR/AcrR family transcriptional regulator n=1 Tax=Microcella sp. TaxID=1913979 RepID=UPI00256BBDDD|nr:TetR/AcrR family transcriptional regulator [Microcella sp.]MBX9471566.1 TetR/AcrR family transcriptional regulator [Microcella sp.]
MSSATPAPRARNRPGEGGRLRDDIVDAADALLADAGSAARLSLRAIAREVGITAPAIYAHFSTKEQLLSAVVARRFGGLAQALQDARPSGSADDETIAAIAIVRARTGAYVAYGLEYPGVYAALFGPDADHLGFTFEGSPGEEVFAALLDPVSIALGDRADALAVATDLWVAMHGIVTLRSSQRGFVWGDLDAQLDRVVGALLAAAPTR